MLIRNWNPVDDDYLDIEEVRQREDRREAQYQQDREKYKISVNGLCLIEEPDKHGIARFDKNPKDALIMHLPECKRAIEMVDDEIQAEHPERVLQAMMAIYAWFYFKRCGL